MCLAIPGKVKEISGRQATISYPNEDRQVYVGDEPVSVGDYVMVQMGVIIKIIGEEEAALSLKAWTSNT